MHILVVASRNPHGTAAHRTAAMHRLGHTVTALDTDPFLASGARIVNWLRMRTLIGPTVTAINRAVLDAAATERFDLVWLDKPIWVRPATVSALRTTGAMVVSYMPDNPFGPRGDPGWRLFLGSVSEYSAHVVSNPAGMPHYRAAGAAHVLLMPQSYEPTVHFPPPEGWDDSKRDIEVCFVGSPYDDRAGFLRALWRDHGIAARVWGEPRPWRRAFDAATMAALHAGSAVYGDDYRQIIWRSRICLGFVTHANRDTFARRWFEIAGAGGFLLAERTDDGLRSFADGREAVFFSDVAECAAAIRRYLPDEPARAAIARAGRARAVASGYDNDTRLRRVFDELAALRPAVRTTPAPKAGGLRILHIGSYAPNGTPRHRAAAMRRLGHAVADLDIDPVLGQPSRIVAALRIRLLVGPAIAALNRQILSVARESAYDVIWCDKPIWIQPATVRALRATGAAVVSYMPDNPYGPRGDPGWRLFLKSVPHYSAHIVVNPAGMPHYRAAGAPRVLLMPVPYEPTIHFPPPAGWDDSMRDIEVSFVGSPYGQRAEFLRALWRDEGIAVQVWGEPGMWQRVFDAEEMARFHAGSAVYNDDYRKIIWRSRINLGFVTHANLDTFAQRWFEISGSAGFLLAERTADGLRTFDSGREAAFFDGVAECAAQIRRYLPDAAARAAIARAGHARAVASGYDNDGRLRTVFAALADLMPRR